ncbi:type II toxin-antitoxin system HicB family antitoxin [Oceaniradius stylonematis]|uniref:Type II toxin-antitoxin system HicB family antitoxin n=1 Tax=Oceaniradius stylonematis TaxID=2184161 RepID=A0A3A8AR77_9HYPH|nr:type II toxin-antitoxin system HicB family antitoxin [Oceaniradius stylonematis]RKF08081.1 type II toxin-antitoxin system HicB family antitoxin [Oceaniradius stylonematis]
MKRYRGFVPDIWWEEDDAAFHGRVSNVSDMIHFSAGSMTELQNAFEDSVDDYLEFCAEKGIEPKKPYSGRLALRLDPEVHAMADEAAKRTGRSLNQWIMDTVSEAASAENDRRRIRIRNR